MTRRGAGWRGRGTGRLWLLLLAAALGPLLGTAAPLAAQHLPNQAATAGVIRVRVVDSQRLHPLGGSSVILEPLGPVAEPRNGGDGEDSRGRVALTDSAGEYRFERLVAVEYRVWVRRVGYRARSVDVDLRTGRAPSIVLALDPAPVEPVVLPQVEVTGRMQPPFARTQSVSAEVAGARSRTARRRQEESLVSDAREVTYADVLEAVTLGEPDLFRALQRIPGVTTRDDYTATLWTRGAPWDQTRVYFDGLPLYNPTHAGWLFSAVNPDALGDVAFYPGTRSARWGEGAAAVLDLRTRPGGRGPEVNGVGELSLASARVALDGGLFDNRMGWMVAGRRTYVDLLGAVARSVTGDADLNFPYDFQDVIVRLDGEPAAGWRVEASGILEQDNLRGDLPGLLVRNEGKWGNLAGRVSVTAPLGPLQARVTVGETRFGTTIYEREVPSREDDGAAKTLEALENAIRHDVLEAELSPAGSRGWAPWSVGVQLVRDSVSYNGAAFELLPGSLQTYGTSLVYAGLWGERRWSAGPLQLETGLRAEMGRAVNNGGRVRIAPRFAAGYWLGDATSLSAGWARTFQYTQDVSPTAGPVGPQLHLSNLWVLSKGGAGQDARTAVRADVATAGVERWWGGEAWLTAATLYQRRATGVIVPNPHAGRVFLDRDLDAVAVNTARGIELSARRLQGRLTGSIGYAYGTSRLSTSTALINGSPDSTSFDYPSPAQVEHSLDATALYRATRRLSGGLAFTYSSGSPYTQLVLPAGGVTDENPAVLREPNAKRSPSYASLDLMLEYTKQVGTWRLSGYAQLRNVLGRNNSVAYQGSRDCGVRSALASAGSDVPECAGPVASEDGVRDHFQPGLPRLPLIGVRFTF